MAACPSASSVSSMRSDSPSTGRRGRSGGSRPWTRSRAAKPVEPKRSATCERRSKANSPSVSIPSLRSVAASSAIGSACIANQSTGAEAKNSRR